jgi:hypothetical protein
MSSRVHAQVAYIAQVLLHPSREGHECFEWAKERPLVPTQPTQYTHAAGISRPRLLSSLDTLASKSRALENCTDISLHVSLVIWSL